MVNFSNILIEWYKENKRDLPWRNTSDPYTIWISEIILQQTRVAQGYDYFIRFMTRFPDVKSLADAPEDEVMKYWQGLGYYSRARNLHAAAKSMNNVFPSTYDAILSLKGVGEYTAAAISSFAFNLPHAVLDGNVFRLLSRYFDVAIPIDTTQGKKYFTALANNLLDKNNPAIYNQSIMEFGALMCRPKSPDCLVCPLNVSCGALSKGIVDELPQKQKKIKTSQRYLNYIFIRNGDYTYVRKRQSSDIWRNLYEFYLIETPISGDECQLFETYQFKELITGIKDYTLQQHFCNLKHVLSHQVLEASFYELTCNELMADIPGYTKIHVDEIHQYAVPKLIEKFIQKIKL